MLENTDNIQFTKWGLKIFLSDILLNSGKNPTELENKIDTEIDNNASELESWLTSLEVDTAIEEYLLANPVSSSSIFPIWAEENSSLGTNTYEWAFWNGANSPQNGGIVIPFDCEVFAMSGNFASWTCTVQLEVNGSLVTWANVTRVSTRNNYNTFVTPVSINAWDTINFKSVASVGTWSPNTVTAWLRT